jgi:hypothetical protein
MRASTSIVVPAAFLLGACHAFADSPTQTGPRSPAAIGAGKEVAASATALPDPISIDVGGDILGSAVAIPAIPYSDTGSTCQFVHDYDESCPYVLPGGRDVVYRFTPTVDTGIGIDLCSSAYDTKVYVYEGAVGNVVACNDDACGTAGWRSYVPCVPLQAGRTYYIVVDGYGPSDCGFYDLSVMETCKSCYSGCPPGGIAEGEPPCHEGYVDAYNAGCHLDPPEFSILPCSDPGVTTRVCGTFGGFLLEGADSRDTDWYQIVLTEPSTIHWCVCSTAETLTGILDGRAGCPPPGFHVYAIGGLFGPACVSADLPAGTWWLWVGTTGFGPSVGCEHAYVAELGGYHCGPTPVRPATWGRTKSLYR